MNIGEVLSFDDIIDFYNRKIHNADFTMSASCVGNYCHDCVILNKLNEYTKDNITYNLPIVMERENGICQKIDSDITLKVRVLLKNNCEQCLLPSTLLYKSCDDLTIRLKIYSLMIDYSLKIRILLTCNNHYILFKDKTQYNDIDSIVKFYPDVKSCLNDVLKQLHNILNMSNKYDISYTKHKLCYIRENKKIHVCIRDTSGAYTYGGIRYISSNVFIPNRTLTPDNVYNIKMIDSQKYLKCGYEGKHLTQLFSNNCTGFTTYQFLITNISEEHLKLTPLYDQLFKDVDYTNISSSWLRCDALDILGQYVKTI